MARRDRDGYVSGTKGLCFESVNGISPYFSVGGMAYDCNWTFDQSVLATMPF